MHRRRTVRFQDRSSVKQARLVAATEWQRTSRARSSSPMTRWQVVVAAVRSHKLTHYFYNI
jgi:hypothetical protein